MFKRTKNAVTTCYKSTSLYNQIKQLEVLISNIGDETNDISELFKYRYKNAWENTQSGNTQSGNTMGAVVYPVIFTPLLTKHIHIGICEACGTKQRLTHCCVFDDDVYSNIDSGCYVRYQCISEVYKYFRDNKENLLRGHKPTINELNNRLTLASNINNIQ